MHSRRCRLDGKEPHIRIGSGSHPVADHPSHLPSPHNDAHFNLSLSGRLEAINEKIADNEHQKANFLSSVGEKTPIFVRFSTVTLGREFPDEARNPRGFAIKFYTKEGNYDIVGLNFVCFLQQYADVQWLMVLQQPVFFCRDPIQGPDVIRSQSRNPKNFLLDYDATFDLLGCTPEGCAFRVRSMCIYLI